MMSPQYILYYENNILGKLQLVKDAHKESETAKVSVRSARKDGNDFLKKLLKGKEISEDEEKIAVEEIQELTDSYTKKIDLMLQAKEKEILTI